LKLSIEVLSFWTDELGLPSGKSLLDCWKDNQGKHKYRMLCPEDLMDMVGYPCKTEIDGKVVAMLVGSAFWLDITHQYKAGQGHYVLQLGNCQAMAKFAAANPKYSQLGCHLLVDFWFKGSTFSQISKAIAAQTATQVDTMKKT
jgi:hypothetical protein